MTTRLDLGFDTNHNDPNEYYKSFALSPSAGKVVFCLRDEIVIYGGGGAQERLSIKPFGSLDKNKLVNFYNNYEYRPSSTDPYKGWMKLHTDVYYVPDIRNQDIQSWVSFPGIKANKIICNDVSALTLGERELKGSLLSASGSTRSINLESNPLIKGRVMTSFILLGDVLYIGFRDFDGMVECNLATGAVTSKIEGLNLTNATGNKPNSSNCQLALDTTTNTLYAHTQQGQFQRKLNEKSWWEISPAWYNGMVEVIAPGEVIFIANQGTLLYKAKEDRFYPQERLDVGYTRAVAKVGNELITYVRHGGQEPYFTPYFLSTPIQTAPRKEVTNIQELPILQPQDAIKYNGKLYVASKGSGFVEIDGDKAKVISPEPTLAVALRGNVILAVTRSLLISYNPSTAKTEVIKGLGKELNGVRLAASTLYTVIIENVGENGNQFAVYDSNYKEVFRWGESGTYLQDVQISNNEIYVAGFSNRTRQGVPVQVAFLKVFDASKSFQIVRSGWNFDPESLGNDMADARLYRIQLVGDKLYVLGESAGGNSVFRWNGFDLKTQTIAEGVDWFSLGTKTKANHISYTGVLAANTLKVISGQFTLTRTDSMDGNALRAKTLLVNEDSVFVGGMAAYKVQGRDSRKVLGQTLPKYGDVPGDASLLTLSADLNGSRKDWQAIAPADNVIYFDGSVALIEFKGQLKKVDF